MISFLANIISCLTFTLGVLQTLSTSSDTVHLEVWLYPELCGTRGGVIRSLTIYYVIKEERVKKAGKEPSIREVNKKADTAILLSVIFNAESRSQGCENFISAVIFVTSNSFQQRICCLSRKVKIIFCNQ